MANSKITGEIANTLTISSKTDVSMTDKIAVATVAGTNSNLALTKASAGDVKSVAVINGNKELPETNANIIGKLTVSVGWKASADTYVAPTTEEKAALDGMSVVFTISPTGNVVLLTSNARDDNSNETLSIVVTATWDNDGNKFTLAAKDDSDGSVTLGGDDDNEIYFAIEPNNENGPEWIHSDEIGAGKTYAAGTTANPHKNGDTIEPLTGEGAYAKYHTKDGVSVVANPAVGA